MTLTAEIIGTLVGDPFATRTGTGFRVSVFGGQVACFNKENAVEKQREFSAGDRVRVEGRISWGKYDGQDALTIGNCAIDLSDEPDKTKLKADGAFDSDLETNEDGDIPVRLESPTRAPDKSGEWVDTITMVTVLALGPCGKKLIDLEQEGNTNVCFTGDFALEPEFFPGVDEPGFYMEAYEVIPVAARGAETDFRTARSRGLAKRKSPAVKPQKKKSSGGAGKKDPDDELPF